MQVGRPTGTTRVLGKRQGYIGLAIRDETINCPVHGLVSLMASAWLPTPRELEALNAGAAVYVRILGDLHPPIIVGVGEPPSEVSE